jgi:hypothetical protein
MRWILHIGAPKTGSTAIQRFLFDNREGLLARGVHYPDVSLRGFGHHDLAFLLRGRYADWATPQNRSLAELRDDLRDAVQSTPTMTTILSSENFYIYPKPAALHQLLKDVGLLPDDKIVVTCYVRRQDEAHVSWYNQTVKAQGNARSFAATVVHEHALWDYAQQLQPWQAEFGADAILVRDYSSLSQPGGDVCADILDILGLPSDAFPLPPGRVNERINRDILEFQRLVNRLPLSPRQKRRYHKQLIELTKVSTDWGVFDDTPFLTAASREALMQSYNESNSTLARTYLGRATLFRLVEGAGFDATEDAPLSTVRKGLTIAKLAHIVAWISSRRSRSPTKFW